MKHWKSSIQFSSPQPALVPSANARTIFLLVSYFAWQSLLNVEEIITKATDGWKVPQPFMLNSTSNDSGAVVAHQAITLRLRNSTESLQCYSQDRHQQAKFIGNSSKQSLDGLTLKTRFCLRPTAHTMCDSSKPKCELPNRPEACSTVYLYAVSVRCCETFTAAGAPSKSKWEKPFSLRCRLIDDDLCLEIEALGGWCIIMAR